MKGEDVITSENFEKVSKFFQNQEIKMVVSKETNETFKKRHESWLGIDMECY